MPCGDEGANRRPRSGTPSVANTAGSPPVCTKTTSRPAHRPSPRLITSGDEGFHTYCDLRAGIQRAQTFTVHRTGVLRGVQDTTFRSATTPNGDVTVSLATTDVNGRPATVLASTTVPAAATSLAPASITLPTHVRVRAGQTLAIVVSSTATSGCYGMSYSDDDPYAGGAEFYSSDGGTTWRTEPGRDLHVRAYLV